MMHPVGAPSQPRVSVVIATYHRPRALVCAIRTVLVSTCQDFEVIVVGDGCTDTTEAAIRALADPRVHFLNLDANTGDQSAPTNAGINAARAPVIALLNHDDLWLPHHLTDALQVLDTTGADLVWSSTCELRDVAAPVRFAGRWRVAIGSTPVGGLTYDPLTACPASSWVFRRTAAVRVGPWRAGKDLYVFPSQDWLFRASRAGLQLVFNPRPGVLVLASGHRPSSYRDHQAEEHVALVDAICTRPNPLEELLVCAAVTSAASPRAEPWHRRIMRRCATVMAWFIRRVGGGEIHPKALHGLLLYGRGGVTRHHRDTAGVDDSRRV